MAAAETPMQGFVAHERRLEEMTEGVMLAGIFAGFAAIVFCLVILFSKRPRKEQDDDAPPAGGMMVDPPAAYDPNAVMGQRYQIPPAYGEQQVLYVQQSPYQKPMARQQAVSYTRRGYHQPAPRYVFA